MATALLSSDIAVAEASGNGSYSRHNTNQSLAPILIPPVRYLLVLLRALNFITFHVRYIYGYH